MKKVRIFMPIGNQYYLESCWVMVNGKPSFDPPTAQPQMREKSFIDQEVLKGNAVVDATMSMAENLSGKKAKVEGSPSAGAGVRGVEKHQMSFTMTDAVDEGKARLGWTAVAGLFDSSIIKGANTTVGGKFTTSVLVYLGYLLQYGVLRFTRIEFNGSADAVFEIAQPKYKRFNALGETIVDKFIEYPLPNASDNDTTIRKMDEKYFSDQNVELFFDGLGYLELSVPKDATLQATIYFDYIANA